MNEFELVSAIQLDRLVDGELSESERREILTALEREECSVTCGWRRLALAFVEDQSLRQDLRRLTAEVPSRFSDLPREESRASLASSSAIKPNTIDNRLLTSKISANIKKRNSAAAAWQCATLVACCLIAFNFGRLSGLPPVEIAISEPRVEPVTRPDMESPARQENEESLVAVNANSPVEKWASLRLVLEDVEGTPTQSIDIPMVSDIGIDPIAFFDAPPSVPLAVRQALLRQGRVVQEQRQLLEIELSDGRRGVLPVSDVSVVDAGTDLFQ